MRVELPDELIGLLRQVAIPSAAPLRAKANKTWTEARKEALRRLWTAGVRAHVGLVQRGT